MNLFGQITDTIKTALKTAALAARDSGALEFKRLPEFVVEVPREKGHGDLASNLALVLAREARKAPRQIAELIINHMDASGTWISRMETAGPGFLNFWLDSAWLWKVPALVEAEGNRWGSCQLGEGRRVQVEFVSANPTGLLHMGNARGAALGDTLSNILDAAGYKVTREFYVNDAGHQIENFALSLEARYLELTGQDVAFPDEGYRGEDLIDTVRAFRDAYGQAGLLTMDELRGKLLAYALEEKIQKIKDTLARFQVEYDVWFSERNLHEQGAIADTINELKQKGYVFEEDKALWFKASSLMEDAKDEVLVRSSGVPTYFAADIAYHRDKFQRGFDQVINIWGADHHGHVARLKAALAALGFDPDRLKVIIMQLVRLFQGGEVLRMSKRTGKYVTLEELLDDVGKDAARYFFIMRSADSHLDFDLDLAKAQSQDNPVYYVQYAHARIASILRNAQGYNIPAASETDFSLLRQEAELELLRKIADWPGVVEGAARALEPHRLPYYAHELASAFHKFYTQCRVLQDDPDLSAARLALVKATQATLASVLGMMGVSAPESM